MNPVVGKMPAMADGDLAMFESCAMVQYIIDKHGNGQLQPKPGTADHAYYLQWDWFAESTFARLLGEMVNHRRAFPDATIPTVIEEMKSRSRLCFEVVSQALENQSFSLGDNFIAVDIMMVYSLKIYVRLMEEDLNWLCREVLGAALPTPCLPSNGTSRFLEPVLILIQTAHLR